MKGETTSPPRPDVRHIIYSWLGGFLGIFVISRLSAGVETPLLMAPFGATCVLMFGVLDSPLAQPRNVIGGHVLCTLIGLGFSYFLGNSALSMSLAVATSIAAMQLTKTSHPPAGADPLVIMLSHANWTFLFIPVLAGSLILVALALLFNNILEHRRYPKYWW